MLQNLILRRLQYNRQTRRFFITIIALGFAFDGVYTVLLNLYLLRLEYDTTFIGLVNSMGLLTFAVMGLPAGVLGVRWTSRQMLRVGLGITCIGTLLLPLAEFSPEGWQDAWLIVMYALILSGFALYFVNGAPFLMAVVEREKQRHAFALQTALLSLAAFVGSLVGGNLPEMISHFSAFTLDDPEPFRYTLLTAALVLFVAFLVALTIDEVVEETVEDKPAPTEVQQSLPKTKTNRFTSGLILLIVLMSVIRFLQVTGTATATIYFNVYLDTQLAMSPGLIGIIAAAGRLIAVPASLLVPRLIRRQGTGSIVVWGSLATAAFLVPLALIPIGFMAAFSLIGAFAMSSLRYTAFIVYLMELVPKRQQPLISGAGEMAAGLSFAVMAWGGGLVVAFASFRELFLLGAGLSALGTALFWLHLHHTKGKSPI